MNREEIETLAARAKAAENALLSLTCGGSEFFIRDGDGFRADVPACVAYIRRRQEDMHGTICRAMERAKKAEAALSSLPLLEGWRMVPVEPTDAMIEAAQEEIIQRVQHGIHVYGSDIWSAMLSSAPSLQGGGDLGSVGSKPILPVVSPPVREPADDVWEDDSWIHDSDMESR